MSSITTKINTFPCVASKRMKEEREVHLDHVKHNYERVRRRMDMTELYIVQESISTYIAEINGCGEKVPNHCYAHGQFYIKAGFLIKIATTMCI